MKKWVFLLILFMAVNVNATTYYVKNGGSDSANGTSDETAWATVAKVNSFANTTHFSSGDIIQFKRGSTWSSDQALGFITGGTFVSWGTINGLTIQDYSTGALPFLNGNTHHPINIATSYTVSNLTIKNINASGTDRGGSSDREYNVAIYDVTNIIVDGLVIDGAYGMTLNERRDGALKLGAPRGTAEIKNCVLSNFVKLPLPTTISGTHDWGSYDCNGVDIWWSNPTDTPKLSGVTSIHDNTISNFYADCIAVGGLQSADGTTIYNNTLSGFGEQGIDIKQSAYITVHNNDISHNDFGLSPGGGYQAGVCVAVGSSTSSWPGYSTHDVNIYDNYLHDTKMRAIYVAGTYTKVYRNLLKDVGNAIWVYSSNVDIFDNVFNLTSTLYTGWVDTLKSAMRIDNNANRDNISIVNNTFYISGSSYLYGIGWQGVAGQVGNSIKNNVIQMTANSASVYPLYFQDYDSSNTYPTVNKNLFYNANHANRVMWDGTAYTSSWNSSLFVTPSFNNAATGQFWAASGAASIVNAGEVSTGQVWDDGLIYTSTWTPSISVETLLGVNYSGRDIGAYEYTTPTVATPVISPNGGNDTSFSVTLTCATSGAAIYYTIDGTTPTSGSTLYSTAISITASKTLKAIGIKAGETDSVIVTAIFTVTTSQAPYGGTAWPIPGIIYPWDYDTGGEGVSYHATSSGNAGGVYRSDDVNIWPSVTYTYTVEQQTDEWLEYTINVASDGDYLFYFDVASDAGSRTFNAAIDGTVFSGTLTSPSAGFNNGSEVTSAQVTLTAGTHILKVLAISTDVDAINFMRISGVLVATPKPNAPANFQIIKGTEPVRLEWSAVAAVDGYKVYSGRASGVFSDLYTTTDTYKTAALSTEVPSFLAVSAHKNSIESDLSLIETKFVTTTISAIGGTINWNPIQVVESGGDHTITVTPATSHRLTAYKIDDTWTEWPAANTVPLGVVSADKTVQIVTQVRPTLWPGN